MNLHLAAAAVALGLAAAIPAANATTLINADKSAHKVTVLPKGAMAIHLDLKAKQSASVDCSKGCQFMLGKVKASYGGKTAKVWIKNAKFTAS
jgi:hypothetical protein